MRLLEIAIAADQLLNAVCGGYADETMSARCWRLRAVAPYRYLQPAIDALFFWQPNHCELAYQSEVVRSQLPGEYSPSEARAVVNSSKPYRVDGSARTTVE